MITEYYLGYFYGFVYFINIFGVIFIFSLYHIITKIRKKELIYSLKKTFVIQNILRVGLFVFSFSYIIQFLPSILRQNFFLTVIMFFLFYSLLELLLEKKMIYFIFFLALLRLAIDFKSILSWNYLMLFLSQIIALLVLRFVLLRLSYFAFTRRVRVGELEKGMFLAEIGRASCRERVYTKV